jgi:flagellar motor switch protein FliN/FliY
VADPKDSSIPGEVPNAGASAPRNDSTDADRLNTNEIEKLLDQATKSLEQASGEGASVEPTARPFTLGDLKPKTDDQQRQPIDLLGEVEMDLRIELGRTLMRLDEVLQLRSGSVVALDKLAGDPVDIFVNGRLIARGEVLVMNDNFCIRVTELVGV